MRYNSDEWRFFIAKRTQLIGHCAPKMVLLQEIIGVVQHKYGRIHDGIVKFTENINKFCSFGISVIPLTTNRCVLQDTCGKGYDKQNKIVETECLFLLLMTLFDRWSCMSIALHKTQIDHNPN